MARATSIGALAAGALLAACSSSPNGPSSAHPEGGVPDAAVEHADSGDGPSDAPADRPDGLGAGRCGRTALATRATIAVRGPSGDLVSCARAAADAGTQPPLTWSGVVTSSDATTIVVATCGGDGSDAGATDAGCPASSITVEAHAPGLDLSRFPHVRVRVRAKARTFYQCQQALEITADDATDADAQGASGALLLAVNDGGDIFDAAPFGVAHVPLGCPQSSLCASSVVPGADEYAFDFSDSADITHRLRVYMGDTASWTLGASSYTVHNLRSFQSCATDDYWNWAYTIYVDPK